jgi:hypothetical protein
MQARKFADNDMFCYGKGKPEEEKNQMYEHFGQCTEATSLEEKIPVFDKSQCSVKFSSEKYG